MRAALAFLTPLGGAAAPSPAALRWFPAVGAGMGAALGSVWWAAGEVWAAGVAAAVVVAADLALTGFLHLDGLVDAADGLLPPLAGPERRLEVMADPGAGAFGVGAAVALLLARWAALAALVPSVALLAGLWCGSRAVMAGVVATVPYARPGGLAAAFSGGGRGLPAPVPALLGLAGAAALASAGWRPGPGLAAMGALVVTAVAVVALARRRVGGFTGDVLGAAGLVGETAGLLVAAARW